MKKVLIISLFLILSMLGFAFILPSIKQVQSLPDDMIVTFADIEEANKQNVYSPVINLDLPKNIDVATNGELTDTTMSIKLFNLFTIKKVNIKLLTDTDVLH